MPNILRTLFGKKPVKKTMEESKKAGDNEGYATNYMVKHSCGNLVYVVIHALSLEPITHMQTACHT